jgi:hypothetical protein
VERVAQVRRTWAGAAWHARQAVQCRLSLDDHLRARLASYLAALPLPRGHLPLRVEIRDGDLAVEPVEPSAEPALPAPEGEPWLAPLVALSGPAVGREVAELRRRVAAVTDRAAAARRRAEELQARFAADVAAGAITSAPDLTMVPELLGRPPVPSILPRAALMGLVAVSLVAEAWQLAVPILAAAGIAPLELGAELAARPAEAVLDLAFALGIALALFALAQGALAAAVHHRAQTPGATRWPGLDALLAGVAAAVVAAAGAALGGGAWAQIPLLLAVPLGAALLVARARAAEEARRVAAAAALAWDRARAVRLADRARREQEVSLAVDEERALLAERGAVLARLEVLHQRAREAEHLLADAAARTRRERAQVAQSLVGALELDRHAFVRQATAHGALELLGRRKPPEPPRPVASVVEAEVTAPVTDRRRVS